MENLFDGKLIGQRRMRALARNNGSATFLLDIAARELADRLAVVERHFERGAELFGATGITARDALKTGKLASVRRIETHAAFSNTGEDLVTAEWEDVPLETNSVNLVLSPLAFHLVNDLPGHLVRIRRALKPDGLLLAAIPGAGTLAELRDALLSAEAELTGGASPRVIPFADIRDIGALLQRAGFALPVVDTENYTVRYDSLFPLMADLRSMGMSNPLTGRSRMPVNKRFFMRSAEIYAERHADPDGRIRATFTFIYVSGWAPHESQQKPLKPGSAKMRLADALRPTG